MLPCIGYCSLRLRIYILLVNLWLRCSLQQFDTNMCQEKGRVYFRYQGKFCYETLRVSLVLNFCFLPQTLHIILFSRSRSALSSFRY
ncbi:hypothetical protein DFP73DRAFT_557901 [Morchella snyderi]|nr:hypothetical protein DFP73DRAFT_557901 [Morchella snyderi]